MFGTKQALKIAFVLQKTRAFNGIPVGSCDVSFVPLNKNILQLIQKSEYPKCTSFLLCVRHKQLLSSTCRNISS